MAHPQFKLVPLIGLLLALALCNGGASAQEPQPTKDDKATADAALRSKAIDLLETVADQIGTLQSAENRARLGSNLAASLWKPNEQRARGLLAAVQSDINAALQKNDEDERSLNETRMVFLKLRMDTAERIAKLDAEAALAFVKATEPTFDLMTNYQIAEMTRSLEVRLANQIAAENPEFALKLARKSLAQGFSNDLLPLLGSLHKKDKEKAQTLFKEMVAKLVRNGLPQFSPAFYFAQGLARTHKPPVADVETYRELIKLFIDAAFENGCDKTIEEGNSKHYFCQALGALLPQMEIVDPSRTANLKHWQSDTEPHYNPEVYEEIEQINRNGTVDEMLELAEKIPQLRREIYWRAVMMAQESGNLERARKIAQTYVTDQETREELLAQLDRAEAWQSMGSEKLKEAQAALAEIPTVRGKVGFLLYLANQVGAKDRKSALRLLSQASEMVDTMKPGREQTDAEISLAMSYCVEKDQRCFDRMQALLPKINELIAAAVKLDGYDSHNVRDGEWNMSNEGSIGSLLTSLSANAAYFAWCDFDRAISMTGQFERPEIRLMAQLKLAQSILAGPPKRLALNAYFGFH